MIEGHFSRSGELFFLIDLVAANGLAFPVDALLDTGSTEWLALNSQDLESLGWSFTARKRVQTADGEKTVSVYLGKIILDGQELEIPVVAAMGIEDCLLGLPCLQTRRLIVDFSAEVLTLE
jgi:predicted aspartyl protease